MNSITFSACVIWNDFPRFRHIRYPIFKGGVEFPYFAAMVLVTNVITVQVAGKAGSRCARVISLVYSYPLLEQCYKHTGYLYKLQTQGLLYKVYKEH